MKDDFTLGSLADPMHFQEPLSLLDAAPDDLLRKLECMIRIRKVEVHLAGAKKDKLIGGPVHLGVGQEAVAVGVASVLRSSDRAFGAHRSHSHVLAMGGSVYRLFAEVLGKDSGLSRGMGGSMHLWDQPSGFYGSVPIVSGTVPLAVGAALAAKLQKVDDVGIAFLGDGAVEEGVVHESLNLARVTMAPVVFVVENNLFASHMHISLRQPKDVTARFAAANDIPYAVVDGNDVEAVSKAAQHLIGQARSGGGPGYIEAITYRWYGHVDWREDIDVGVNRSAEEVMLWRKRDPIARLVQGMRLAGMLNDELLGEIERKVDEEILSSWQQALSDPYPHHSALIERVYRRNDEA